MVMILFGVSTDLRDLICLLFTCLTYFLSVEDLDIMVFWTMDDQALLAIGLVITCGASLPSKRATYLNQATSHNSMNLIQV